MSEGFAQTVLIMETIEGSWSNTNVIYVYFLVVKNTIAVNVKSRLLMISQAFLCWMKWSQMAMLAYSDTMAGYYYMPSVGSAFKLMKL